MSTDDAFEAPDAADVPEPLFRRVNEPLPLARAPWTDEQVASLVEFQRSGWFHEFTCGVCGSTLQPRADGWHCWRDAYRQDWAHEFMTNWDWQRWRSDLLRGLFGREESTDERTD